MDLKINCNQIRSLSGELEREIKTMQHSVDALAVVKKNLFLSGKMWYEMQSKINTYINALSNLNQELLSMNHAMDKIYNTYMNCEKNLMGQAAAISISTKSNLDKNKEAGNGAMPSAGSSNSILTLLGLEYENKGVLLASSSILTAFLAKYEMDNITKYFGEKGSSDKTSMKSKYKFDPMNEKTKDVLQKNGYYNEKKGTKYYKNDKEITQKDAPSFYKEKAALFQTGRTGSQEVSLYEINYNDGNTKIDAAVGKAEAHYSVSGGLYVIGDDNKKHFSPGVRAEVGASVTAIEAKWNQQWLGDENFGLNTDVRLTAGKAETKADIVAQVYDENGKLNLQFGGSARIEAIAVEAEGSVGVNVLGGEVGIKGGVNVGIGAHADVGYKDGVFKVDVGASLGVGLSADVEIDIGGMVDTVCEGASAAWGGIQNKWDSLWK